MAIYLKSQQVRGADYVHRRQLTQGLHESASSISAISHLPKGSKDWDEPPMLDRIINIGLTILAAGFLLWLLIIQTTNYTMNGFL